MRAAKKREWDAELKLYGAATWTNAQAADVIEWLQEQARRLRAKAVRGQYAGTFRAKKGL